MNLINTILLKMSWIKIYLDFVTYTTKEERDILIKSVGFRGQDTVRRRIYERIKERKEKGV